jgi:hypothetical protein
VLGKLIKHDFKTQLLFFAILFGSVIAAPVLVYLLTINSDSYDRAILRSLIGGFAAAASIILTLIFGAKPFEREFNENGAYLIHTIPAKVSDLIMSKAILYYIWVVLSGIAAIVAIGASMMSFTYLTDILNYLIGAVSVSPIQNESLSNQIYLVMIIIQILIQPLALFGFIISAMATGHLAGTHKRLGEGLFIVGFIIVSSVYSGFIMSLRLQSMLSDGEFGGTLYIAAEYIDFFIRLAVTAAFYIYAHWVYTKKINVL